MNSSSLVDDAHHLLRVVKLHPQIVSASLSELGENECRIAALFDVEMPFDVRARGLSATGVKAHEPIEIVIRAGYPWKSPTIYFRQDFPRDFPHLQPSLPEALPRPCLVDGSQDEYFAHFGLIEAGILGLLDQLSTWLAKAAVDDLIDPKQGWEPIVRRDLTDTMILDSEKLRSTLSLNGNWCCYTTNFYKFGDADAALGQGSRLFLYPTSKLISIFKRNREIFTSGELRGARGIQGATITAVITPDREGGAPRINDKYFPETVSTYPELLRRAEELGCGKQLRDLFRKLAEYWEDYHCEVPVPIGIILVARRPFPLIGSSSPIELIPYCLELFPTGNWKTFWDQPGQNVVRPMRHLAVATASFLAQMAPSPPSGPIALIGCGSVGSKVALHLARSGVPITGLSDTAVLSPHNMARHALVRPPLVLGKAEELAVELLELGQRPSTYIDNVVEGLRSDEERRLIAPDNTERVLNTTASLLVREGLSGVSKSDFPPRISEIALFGRGQGAFLLSEGAARNPTLVDLLSELSAVVTPAERELLFDPDNGLSEVQIGQGCGSMTMPMSDARLSAMTAAAAEIYQETILDDVNGVLTIGHKSKTEHSTIWRSLSVPPFLEVPIEGSSEWKLRISSRVLETIHRDVALYPTVETGGLLIGTTSARLRLITVVDTLPAPIDSIRTASLFQLGTKGLKRAIMARHKNSGGSLFDVGTWHTHLADHGPSALDRKTASQLAAERPPPSILLISTPMRFHALVGSLPKAS